jgi:opacity protein-like surface antigen
MKKLLIAASLSLAVSAPAFAAGPQQDKFSLSFFGGLDMPVSGDVHTGATALVPDLGPLNPDLEGIDAELRIGARGHDRIYGLATSLGGEFGYGFSDRSEIFGQVRYTTADEGSLRVGGAFVPALNTELPVFGTFTDYKSLAVEVGYRYYFMDSGHARPYVAGRLGATRTDGIRATFEIPDAGISIVDVPFTEKKWAGSAGLDVGVNIPVSERFSISAETGVRYIADLSGDDSAIGGLGLGSINDAGKRVSVPFTLIGRFDF